MHRRRQTSLGVAPSARELFCSVSSTPRSPSPSKQELYELLQQRHRMHSFTRRLKNYMSEKDSGPEVEIPSYMRQTCSSLIKRSNSKTRSKEFSSSAENRGSLEDENVFSGRRLKLVRKALASGGGSSSFALTLDGHPQSTASKLDSLATLSTDFAYISGNYDEVYELDNKLRNEHIMLDKDTMDEALFMTPTVEQESFDNQVPKKGTRTQDSFALLSDGSLCSVNVEFGTSSNTSRFHEANRESFEDVFLTNSHIEELDFQSNEHTISNSLSCTNHSQPPAQSTVSEDMHTEVLLSSWPDEQDFLCEDRGEKLQEITRPDDIAPSLKSTSSSLHQHNMFCDTDESNEPFLRSAFTQDFQNSNSLLQLSTNDLQLADLSHPTDDWRPVSNREDTKPAEDGCFEHSNSLTGENSNSYVTSGRLLGSESSLDSSSKYLAPNVQFSSGLMESDEVVRGEQQKPEDSLSQKVFLSSLQNQSSLPNTVQETHIRGLEDPKEVEIVKEVVRVNPLASSISTPISNNTFKNSSIMYDKQGEDSSLSDSEDEVSEIEESLLLVQSTNPRSLSELHTLQQRPPSADDIALFVKSPRSEVQFRDDHSSRLLSSSPADFYSGQELSIVLDHPGLLDQSSPRFSEVKEGKDGQQQDQLVLGPCDQLKDLARFGKSKRREVDNTSVNWNSSSLREKVQDQSANQQSIGQIDSAEHCRSEIGSAQAASDDQTIEQNLEFSYRSSHSFGRLQVPSRHHHHPKPEKGLKNRLQKLVHTMKESYKEKKKEQETKKKFPHCFQLSMKSCFGCSKAPPVLHEMDSIAPRKE